MQSDSTREWQENAPYWKKHAEPIRVLFAPVTGALIEEAGIRADMTVLDVACGVGEPALTIAEIVGSSGSVTCTDAVAEMVNAAEDAARQRGLTNVEFRQCTADALPFDSDLFDAAVCRLGAMFFPDPLKALGEMLRVIRPGGALALAVWSKLERNPYVHVVNGVISHYVETTPPAPTQSDAFRFAEPGVLVHILAEAGAANVRERLFDFLIEAPLTPAEFWTLRADTSGTLREKLSKLTAAEREQVAQAVQAAAREFFPHDRMSFPAQMLIVSGEKANS
jgi:ubiquinone/menaquinone biosynthesis C-methylase UbiE